MDETTLTLAEQTTSAETMAENEPQPEQESPEISVSEDGDVQYSDEFLGVGGDTGADETSAPETVETPKPDYYTEEELRNTPFSQWDVNRLNGDVKTFAPIVQQQWAQMQSQMHQAQQSASRPQPTPMEQKDLFAAAQKLARERLNVEEDDELDMYDPEHVQALSLATQELRSQDAARIANVQRIYREQDELAKFNYQMSQRPDVGEFDRWAQETFAKQNGGRDLSACIQDYVGRTGDIAGIQRYISEMYSTFQKSKAPKPVAKVPVVESGSSSVNAGKRVDMHNFGDMDEDEQAKALIAMGYV